MFSLPPLTRGSQVMAVLSAAELKHERDLEKLLTLLMSGFVLLCDVLARVLFAPFELPVGIVMSLLGGPFFLSLLLRHKRSRVYD